MNLQIIVTVDKAGAEPQVVDAVVSDVLSSKFLALNNCSNNTCITLDVTTNLSWSSYQSSVFTWDEGSTRCDVFESPDNNPGRWRLPNLAELGQALRNGLTQGNSDAAKYRENRGPDFFLWTSEVRQDDSTQALALMIEGGVSDTFFKDQNLGVICVR